VRGGGGRLGGRQPGHGNDVLNRDNLAV